MAGFSPNRGNAVTLKRKQCILERVAEIQAERREVEGAATKQAIDALAITKERVMEELARIGFADIRKAVKRGPKQQVKEMPDGSVVYSSGASLIDSSEIDDATASAISEIGNTRDGAKIKFHDKKGALVELLRLLNEMDASKAQDGELNDDDPIMLPRPGFKVGIAEAIKRYGGREN